MRVLLSSLILLLVLNCRAQFPDSATYIGAIKIEHKGMLKQIMPLKFEIAKQNDSTWTWRMTFNDTKNALLKDYVMRRTENGYILDEQNGIQLPGTFVGDRLRFQYTLNDSTLYTVDHAWEGDSIVRFDLSYYKVDHADELENFTIKSFQIQGRQYAVLRRYP